MDEAVIRPHPGSQFYAPMAERESLPPRGTLNSAAAGRCVFQTGARATSSMATRLAGRAPRCAQALASHQIPRCKLDKPSPSRFVLFGPHGGSPRG